MIAWTGRGHTFTSPNGRSPVTSEFDLIRKYFFRPSPSAILGGGDDCALVVPAPGMELAISTDMLVEGTHFPEGTHPAAIGHKALAVNLSDLAAMGARARWSLLSIAMPDVDEAWTAVFATGFFKLAEQHGVELIGGDTTRGPLTLSLTVMGEVPQGMALRRSGAKVGDDIWLSGETGGAALALADLQGRLDEPPASGLRASLVRLEYPEPRLELGMKLHNLAHSAIDVSDGLVADLGHIAAASGVAAQVRYDALPRPADFSGIPEALAQDCLLSGGDDYELLFTAPVGVREKVQELSNDLGLRLSRIGTMVPGRGEVVVLRADGAPMTLSRRGYDHFAK